MFLAFVPINDHVFAVARPMIIDLRLNAKFRLKMLLSKMELVKIITILIF
jgi:hypothetical protein